MGQRLNIEIVSGEERLANAYYHWSAYTYSAIELTMTALNEYFERENVHETKLQKAVRMLEATGARLTLAEIAMAKEDPKIPEFEFIQAESVDRNDGLLSVTEKGMDDTERYEEGRVSIYLDEKTVDFAVVHIYLKNEYEGTDEEEWYNEISEEADQFDGELMGIPFDQFYGMKRLYHQHPYGIKYADKDYVSDAVVRWVE